METTFNKEATMFPATCTVRTATAGCCGKPAVWANGTHAECADHANDPISLANGTAVAPQPTRRPGTVTVRGISLRNRSHRRYLVVAVRERDIQTVEGYLVKFAYIETRSDNLLTARKRAAQGNYRAGEGVEYVVVDATTGQEI